MTPRRLLAAAAVLFTATACTQTPPAPAAAPAPAAPAFEAVLSVKELMEHIIDPIADWVFDAATIDVTAKGITETKPVTDDDWLKVERGALILAESSNLLKIHRPVAAAGSERVNEPGKPAPELSTQEIQTKIDGDYALWQKHADELRVAALQTLAIVRKRDVQGLFEAGAIIDKACESCHLEYWYPGDRKVVEEDAKKTVTFDKKPPSP
jgi:hypothetical protein